MNKLKIQILCTCAILLVTALSMASANDGKQLYATKACAGCHGPDARSPVIPMYPRIAGQNTDYLYNQLRDIKDGSRSNGQSVVMKGIMTGVSDEEMRAIASWLATQ